MKQQVKFSQKNLFLLAILTIIMGVTSCTPRYGCYYSINEMPVEVNAVTEGCQEAQVRTEGISDYRLGAENARFGSSNSQLGGIHLQPVIE